MGDVIPFPTASRLLEFGAQLMDESSSRSSSDVTERSNDQRRNAELRYIHSAFRNVPTFKTPHDVIQAAQNLTEMLADARENGITKALIARKIWPQDSDNPSKRFDKLTVPSQGNLSEGRINRLQKRTSHYAKVAIALGENVPGWLPNATLVQVFRKTSVQRELDAIIEGREKRIDDPDYRWRNLASMLDSLTKSVSREAGLGAHLQHIEKMSGRYDLATNKILPTYSDITSESADRLLPHGPLADNFEIVDHFPPIPSAPLFDELLVPPFRHHLMITSMASKVTTNLEVEVRVWRQLRLAIGPVNTIDEVGSLFEVRTRLELVDGDKLIGLSRPWLYLDFPDEVIIQIDDLEFQTTIDFSSHDLGGKSWRDLLWRDRTICTNSGAPSPANLQPEHNYAAWRSVTPELCAELFNQPAANDGSSNFRIYFHTPITGPTLAPERTLGAALENALRSNEEPTLAFALLEEAKLLVALVEDERKRRNIEAMKLNDDAVSRWR